MEINYFAAARAARGVEQEKRENPPATLGELLDELAAENPEPPAPGLALGEVLDRCSFLLDGHRAPRDAALDGIERLDILPPFAGG